MWQVNNLWVTSNNVASFQRFTSGRLGGYVKVNIGYSRKTLMDRETRGRVFKGRSTTVFTNSTSVACLLRVRNCEQSGLAPWFRL